MTDAPKRIRASAFWRGNQYHRSHHATDCSEHEFSNVEYVRADLVTPPEVVEQMREALNRQGDNMAFLLNHVTLPNAWYEKFTRELKQDRAVLVALEESK